MPLAEDPMNDAHTRLAQARFEKELMDAEDPGGTEVILIALGGFLILCAASFLVLFFTTLAVIVFPLLFFFASQVRRHLVTTAIMTALVLWGTILVFAVTLIAMGIMNTGDTLAYWGKVIALDTQGKVGVGLIAHFADGPNARDWVIITPRQVGFAMVGVPLAVASFWHIKALQIVWRNLSWIVYNLTGAGKYDHVRDMAAGRSHQTINITPNEHVRDRVDYGDAEYTTAEEEAEEVHDFGEEPEQGHSSSHYARGFNPTVLKERARFMYLRLKRSDVDPFDTSAMIELFKVWSDLTLPQAKICLDEVLIMEETENNERVGLMVDVLFGILHDTNMADDIFTEVGATV